MKKLIVLNFVVNIGLLLWISYLIIYYGTGDISRSDILNTVGVVVTCLSFAAGMAVLVLAVNTFVHQRELSLIRLEAEKYGADMKGARDSLVNVMDSVSSASQSLLSMILVLNRQIEVEIEKEGMAAGSPLERAIDRDYRTFNQVRLLQKVFIDTVAKKKMNYCRDIIGFIEVGDQKWILLKVIDELKALNDSGEVYVYPELFSLAYEKLAAMERSVGKQVD